MSVSRVLASLNSIHVGDMDAIRARLDEARSACLDLEQPELADKLREARQALDTADLRTFRKRVETVVARLGHLRVR